MLPADRTSYHVSREFGGPMSDETSLTPVTPRIARDRPAILSPDFAFRAFFFSAFFFRAMRLPIFRPEPRWMRELLRSLNQPLSDL
jgi:hypothetical protein